MKKLNITQLQSGGLITNYYCSSRCKHCLYGCSPSWENKYITAPEAAQIFKTIKELGSGSIHIGGGEPMLNIPSLLPVLDAASNEGISIEYIETNSSWYKDKESAHTILSSLKNHGISTLLISISPFHNEHIKFKKVKEVIKACQRVGISVFPWIKEFYGDINSFDEEKTHSLEEYSAKFGPDYIKQIPSRYWIHFGGRSLETFSKILSLTPLENILEESYGCRELSETTHFHFDLWGNYIPGLCSGLAIECKDMGKELDTEKYPYINLLYNEGIKGLLENTESKFGFKSEKSYLSKCHLCFEIRRFLVLGKKIDSPDLQPVEFYQQV